MRLVANKRSNQPSLRPCRAREDHLHEGVLQGQITRVTPAAIKIRMQRFSEGNFIGTSVQRCRTVLSCTKQATFLFPEPHSAVGSEFHGTRTRDRQGQGCTISRQADRVRNDTYFSATRTALGPSDQNLARFVHGTDGTTAAPRSIIDLTAVRSTIRTFLQPEQPFDRRIRIWHESYTGQENDGTSLSS